MAAAEEVLSPEELQVAHWRLEQLLALGMDEDTADWLAHGTGSWHDMDDLLRKGCPPELAIEILT